MNDFDIASTVRRATRTLPPPTAARSAQRAPHRAHTALTFRPRTQMFVADPDIPSTLDYPAAPSPSTANQPA